MKVISLATASALLAFCCSTAHAQEISIDKLTADLQRADAGSQRFRLIWWIPTEYWETAFRNDPNLNESQKQEFYRAIKDYVVVSIVDADMSELGNVKTTSRDQILGKLSLTIGENQRLAPLADSQVSLSARTFFAMMKPAFTTNLGQVGQGIEFFYFKGLDNNGQRILDPRTEGSFTVSYGESVYKWHLPLGSLLPPKFDADTGEQFPGNYLFSPFTGKRLSLRQP